MRTRRDGRRLALLVAVALMLGAPTAEAHLVSTGLGPVYDGIGHISTSVEDLVAAVALALYAGLRGPAPGRLTLFALPATWFTGGMAGLAVTLPEWPQPVLSGLVAATFMIPGILVAADLKLPTTGVAILAGVLGALHGLLDAQGMLNEGVPAAAAVLQFVGMAAVLFVLVALGAAMVVALKEGTGRIIVRVAGSWIAATGLLLLGWSLRGVG